MIWLWNHTSHTKVYFYEIVANVLRDNMGMIIFDLRGCEGCAVRDKNIISRHTLWHFNSKFNSCLSPSSAYPRFTKKFLSVMTLDLHSASMSWILEPSPQPTGLDFKLPICTERPVFIWCMNNWHKITKYVLSATKFCWIPVWSSEIFWFYFKTAFIFKVRVSQGHC